MQKKLIALVVLAALAGAHPAQAGDSSMDTAKEYLDKGEHKAAVIELKNFLKDNPQNADARLLIGETYMKLGDGPAAVKEFEKARDLNAPKDKWIASLGRAYLLQNDTKSLLDNIKPDEDLAPPLRAQIFGIIGAAYISKNDPAKAQENFDAALKLDPDASEALLGLAMLQAQQKQFAKTIEYAAKVVGKDDKNLNAWVIMAEAKRLNGDLPGAVDAFDKALKILPVDIRARLGRATAQLTLNKVDEAAKDVAVVRKAFGDVPLAMYLEAVVDYQQKKLNEAQELLAKVSNALPDHLPSKLLLGTIAYQKGELETAESQLSQFVNKLPKHLPAVKLLAATRLKQHRPTEAISLLKGVEDLGKDDAQFLSLLGSAYLESKQFDQGTEYLTRAAQLDPKAATIKAQLALGRMASGHLDEAVTDLKAAVELDQNLLQADVMLVLALLQDGKRDEAIEAANKLKGKLKEDPLPENLLGAAYMAKGDPDKAREHWKAALKLNPEYATAAVNLAKLEISANNTDAAIELYKGVLKHNPASVSALIGLAQVAEGKKDYAQMEQYLETAREKNPKMPQPSLMLTKYHLTQGKLLRALEVARDADANNPDQPQVMQNLAVAQLANDQVSSAVITFKKLVNKVPDNPEYRHQLAQALYKAGDKTGAREEWRNAARAAPDYIPAYLAQAELAVQLASDDKKYEEAQKMADIIKQRQPQSPVGWQLEGDIWLAQKQYKNAIAAYDKAYQVTPTAILARRLFQAHKAQGNDQAAFDALNKWLQAHGDDMESWLMLGIGYQTKGKGKEAVNAYERAYALKPNNPLLQNNLAWLYQEQGDKRALDLAEKLLTASETNPEIKDTVGWIYVQNNMVDKGLTLLQDAAVHAPQQTQIRLHIAQALVKAGREAEARKELDVLLKDKRDFPERAQAEALHKELEAAQKRRDTLRQGL
ncbi:XrtA/PEP-CTERM system TPR-repeat protein PrsT [Methylomagnum sp.]